MSVVEDVRKVLQDFLAPELRALTARMDAADKIAEARYQEVKANAEARHQEIMTRLEGLKSSLELDKRVERLEGRQPHHPS
jgi:chorismate mutase